MVLTVAVRSEQADAMGCVESQLMAKTLSTVQDDYQPMRYSSSLPRPKFRVMAKGEGRLGTHARPTIPVSPGAPPAASCTKPPSRRWCRPTGG